MSEVVCFAVINQDPKLQTLPFDKIARPPVSACIGSPGETISQVDVPLNLPNAKAA